MHRFALTERDSATETLDKRLGAKPSRQCLLPTFPNRIKVEPVRMDYLDSYYSGVEETDETSRLCRLNLAIHDLEGDIRHGGQVHCYSDTPHDATRHFDLVHKLNSFSV